MSNFCVRGRAAGVLLKHCCRRLASPLLLNDKFARSSPIRSYRASILERNQHQILARVPKSIMYECKSLYLLLERYGNKIVGTISQEFRHTSRKPATWVLCVRVELHDVCEGPICIQVTAEKTTKSAAKRQAFSEVLNTLGNLAGGRFSIPANQGRQRHEAKTLKNRVNKALNKPSNESSMPTATPTAAEAAHIAASSIDLEALKVVAAQAAQVARTRVLVIDVEKHEAGPELLEVGIVELDLSERHLSTTHFIVEYAKGTLRDQRYCQSDPEAFAYRGRVVRCSPAEAVAHVQLAVDRAAGGFIVGHSVRSSDIPWLEAAGVNFDTVIAIDVAAVEMAVVRTHQPTGLERLATVGYGLSLLGTLHNAGNDAVATAAVFAEQLRRHTRYSAGWMTEELLHPASPPWVLSRNPVPRYEPLKWIPKFGQAPPKSAVEKYARLRKLSDMILQSPTLSKATPDHIKEQSTRTKNKLQLRFDENPLGSSGTDACKPRRV